MAGSVTCHNCRNLPAPSIFAASYIWGSTPAKAARNIMVPHPVSFQITSNVTMVLNQPELARKLILSPPIAIIASFTSPPSIVKKV
ncbi:hypothetical protein D3C78_1338170 [compost metagenome]